MPPLVDEKGVVIVGAARVAAAAQLGLKSIPVIVARGWSAEQKRAYRLADNQLAARANWDFERLCNELKDLDFAGFDLDLIGFEPDQLETILAGLGSSGLTDPDSVPEGRPLPSSFKMFRRRSVRFMIKRTRARNFASLKCAGSATERHSNS
jgi:ParB-like chromosome segregation protein Spo0J